MANSPLVPRTRNRPSSPALERLPLLGALEQLLVGLARPLRVRFVDVVAGVRQQLDVCLASDLVTAEAHDHPVARIFDEAIAFHRADYADSAR